MATSLTVIHVRGHSPSEVEEALEAIFTDEERPRLLRIEGTFSAVCTRLEGIAEEAGYRYLICRPAAGSAWTPVLELGNRTMELERRLSDRLDGCAVFTIFVYGDVISGYRMARSGVEIDRYTSDPTIFGPGIDEETAEPGSLPLDQEADYELERGHPERFAELLPEGTSPEDFSRVVLQPGWWQDQILAATDDQDHDLEPVGDTEGQQGVEPDDQRGEELALLVDEVDRMRCIGLALELYGPTEYPFSQDLEDIPNRLVGPAIALAFS
ncbi:MAG: hypothetical protein C5B60_01400 [Chloroflexi bacterium]|nr:MAG: hypothetical protein C5B60_01400 [Chloroflexota bacterium]